MRLFDRLQMGPLMDPVSAIGAAVGGIGSIVGGVIGSGAAKKAAAQQQAAADQVAQMASQATAGAQANEGNTVAIANSGVANAAGTANSQLQGLYNTEVQNLNPYLAAGTQGVTSLQQAMAPGGSLAAQFSAPTEAEVEQTPGYQFTLDQGVQALQRSQAATGQLAGGGTLKALTQYGQGLASTNYQQAYNNALNTFQTNHQNTLQGLQALTGLGTTATGQLQNASQFYGGTSSANTASAAQQEAANSLRASEYGGTIGLQGAKVAGDAIEGGANAAAAGTVGSANAWQGALGGVTNAAQFGAFNNALSNGSTASTPSGFVPYSQASPTPLSLIQAPTLTPPNLNPGAFTGLTGYGAPPAPNY